MRDVPLEDYVAASALSEFAPAAGEPAAVEAMFEVQTDHRPHLRAGAPRPSRRAKGFDLCSTTHCQLYEPERLDDVAMGGGGARGGRAHAPAWSSHSAEGSG